MSFIESPRFPDKISYGSSGGPGYNTDIITVTSGHETRNQNWVQSRHEYDAAFGVTDEARLSELITFFHAMAGMAHEFRFKDWGDYKSCDLNQTPSELDQVIGTGDSSDGSVDNTYTGSITTVNTQRTIFTDTTRTEGDNYFNGLTLTFITGSNSGKTALIISYTSSTKIFIIDSSELIADLVSTDQYSVYKLYTKDFQLIKTYTAGLITERPIDKPVGTGLGDSTVLIKVGSTSQVEDTDYTIDYTTGIVTFIDTHIPLIGESVTSGYEYDVPCRFNSDQLNINYNAYAIGDTNVPIIEVRI